MTVVAIDGPAGAGKSSVARGLAAHLGATYLDSGAMYRAAALAALRRGIAVDGAGAGEDGDADTGAGADRGAGSPAGELSRIISIELLQDGAVLLDGEEVTGLIRTPEVSEAASVLAADPDVRAAMVAQQRALLGSGGDWVAEGRDIGTVVWPQAELKVFLSASPAERAARRAAEHGGDLEAVTAELAARDARDAGRATSPLRPADDAVHVDTTGLTLEQVIEHVAALMEETCQ